MNGIVQTVNGPKPVNDMGKTLMHEHFVFAFPGYQVDMSCDDYLSGEEHLEKACTAAERLKRDGISTVVDATPNECGRDVQMLKEVSKRTGLSILCSTGYYFEGCSSAGYHDFRARTVDIVQEIYEMYVQELTVGIQKTDIKAAVIKLASSKDRITDHEDRFFKAAGKAQRDTGCVIMTHTSEGTFGYEQAKRLIEYGADPAKIVIGHMCGNLDPEAHERILDLGANVALDRIGLVIDTPDDDQRILLIQRLLERGRGDRIVLSGDVCVSFRGRPLIWPEPYATYYSTYYLGYLPEVFVPRLMESGVSAEQIRMMLEENPQRIFAQT